MRKPKKSSRELSLEIDMRTNACACGSNKAPEDCCGTAKLVSHTVWMSELNVKASDGLAVSEKGEVFRRVGKKIAPLIGGTKIQIANLRTGARPKVTARGYAEAQCTINPDLLLLQFDHVLVIDTNTEKHGDETRCASGIFRVEIDRSDCSSIRIGYEPAMLIEFKNPTFNPERTGWLMAINMIKQSPHLSGRKIALITDHDLNSHRSLNLRQESIFCSYKIPKNVRLIYAAADRGAHAINKLMRLADRLASTALKKPGQERLNFSPWINGEEYLCDCLRTTRPDAHDKRWAISETDSISYQRREQSGSEPN